MRHLLTKIYTTCCVILILLSATTSAFAAEQLVLNGEANVDVGDTVKLTIYLSDTTEDIIGFELRLFYDSEYLEFNKESLSAEKFDSLFYNPNIDGMIPMNWTDIGNPVSFSNKSEFFTCEFNVKKAGEAEISYFITEMYGDDMTYLKSYKWTYDLSVNGESLITDAVLPVSKDEETLNTRQSRFINYIDGMGEENTPNKDNHEAVIGKMPSTVNYVQEDVVEVTRYEDVEGSGSGSNSTLYIIIAIPVLGVLVALAIVMFTKNKKESANASRNSNH